MYFYPTDLPTYQITLCLCIVQLYTQIGDLYVAYSSVVIKKWFSYFIVSVCVLIWHCVAVRCIQVVCYVKGMQ